MSIISSLNYFIDKIREDSILMSRPDAIDKKHYDTMVRLGSRLHDTKPDYGDPDYYRYPSKEIEAKVKDNKFYKVWYTRDDASDPADSTSWYTIHYIEEMSESRRALVNLLKALLKELE